MQTSFLPRQLFTRFFIVFSIFLFIVLLCSLPIIFHNTQQLEQSNRQIYIDTITHNLNLINSQIETLRVQLINWGRNSMDFRTLCKSEEEINYLALGKTREEFYRLLNTYHLTRDVLVVTQNNYIFTQFHQVVDRMNLPDLFFQNTLILPNVSTLAEFRDLANSTGALCAPIQSDSYGKYNGLIFFYPMWYSSNMHEIALVMVTLDIDMVLNSISPDGLLETGCTQIFYQDQLVYETGSVEQKGALTTLSAQSETPGLSISFTVPSAFINSMSRGTIHTMWILVLTALLGGLALTLFFLFRTGRPMDNLMRKAQSLAPAISSKNEYDYVAKTLEQLDSTLRQRSEELLIQRKALERSFLEKALLGNITSKQNRRDFMFLFPDFPQRYSLALLHLPLASNLPAEAVMNFTLSKQLMVENLLSRQFSQNLYHFNVTPNLIALILPDNLNSLSAMESFHAAFQQEYRISLNIYLAQSETGPEGLSEAYAHAKRIMRLAAGYIEKRVWHIGNFPQQEMMSSMDYTVMQQLYEAISSGEKDAALRFLRQLQVNLRDQSTHEDAMSAQAYHRTLHFIHSILVRVKQEHFDALYAIHLVAPDLDQPVAAYFSQLEEYVVALSDILLSLRRNRTTFSADIVAYVDQHFTNPELYQKNVADYFNISEKTLQAAIRSVTQLSFSEYLEKKRLDLAHHLLLETDMNVKDISQQAGFALYNTFYKAFKRRWGCSPTEYQMRCKTSASQE